MGLFLITGGAGSVAVTLGIDAPVGLGAVLSGLLLEGIALLGEGTSLILLWAACGPP